MLADTNGDGIADFINGHVVVPPDATAAECAAAANIAARIGYETSEFTPPLVVAAAAGPRLLVGRAAPGMKLMVSAGLAFDYVHLRYLADGDPRITSTRRGAGSTVQFRIDRARPVLLKGVTSPAAQQ
jgi:hypothetical protein